MSRVALVSTLRLSEGDLLLEAQTEIPDRPFRIPEGLTLSEDRSELESGPIDFFDKKVASDFLTVFFVGEEAVPDGEEITDLIAGDLAGDVSRFRPSRPGRTYLPLEGASSASRSVRPDLGDLYFQPQEDRVALLSVIRDRENIDKLQGSPYEVLYSTNRFLLQTAQEVRAERAQIIETFGDAQLYLYDAQPEIFHYGGILLNTSSFPWKAEFIRAYETYLRGTRARESRARVFLIYDDVMREGYILNTAISQSQADLRSVAFQFSMFITRKRLFSMHPQGLGTREGFRRRREDLETEQTLSAGTPLNPLNIPLLFDATVTLEERHAVAAKAQKARARELSLPYLFTRVTNT